MTTPKTTKKPIEQMSIDELLQERTSINASDERAHKTLESNAETRKKIVEALNSHGVLLTGEIAQKPARAPKTSDSPSRASAMINGLKKMLAFRAAILKGLIVVGLTIVGLIGAVAMATFLSWLFSLNEVFAPWAFAAAVTGFILVIVGTIALMLFFVSKSESN
jgi:hypothetical protein